MIDRPDPPAVQRVAHKITVVQGQDAWRSLVLWSDRPPRTLASLDPVELDALGWLADQVAAGER